MNTTKAIPLFFLFLMLIVPFAAMNTHAAFSMVAEPQHGSRGFNQPPFEAQGEILNDTQHDGNDITLKHITKITHLSGYINPTINKDTVYMSSGMIIYSLPLGNLNVQPTTYLDLGNHISGNQITSMVAAPDGLYLTVKKSNNEYASYFVDYATQTPTLIIEDPNNPWYWHKDISDDSAYAARLTVDSVQLAGYHRGQLFFSKDVAFDGYYLVVKKQGNYVAILGSNELKILNLSKNEIKTFAKIGTSDVASTMFYTDVIATDYVYALIDGFYPTTDDSAIEVYTYDGHLVSRYPVPKSSVLFHSQAHNAYVLGGIEGIYVYYGGFTSPAEEYDVSVGSVADDEEYPIFSHGSNIYLFTFKNYTTSGTYISPSVDMDGRIITGVNFQPDYEIQQNTTISFYVSNDDGVTWKAVNTSNGNVPFPNATDGDDKFVWKAVMSGDEYHTPIIHKVSWVLHTEDPVKITEVDMDGWLHTNKSAYYVGDPVDVIVDIKDRDNEGQQWQWEWNFHDPYANSSNPNIVHTPFNATHVYSRPGEYSVTLNVSDIDGHHDSMNTSVIIADRQPVAKIWATTPYGSNDYFIAIHPFDNIMFDARNSTDPDIAWNPDEHITAYRWTTLGLTGSVINTTFNTEGVYSVVLEVQDNYGLTHSTSITVYVSASNLPPQPHISAPDTAQINTAVQFSSDGTIDPDGDPITYFWQFGDGNTSDQPNPSHVYTEYGTYTVNLTVSDGNHNVSYYHMITILPYPASGDWVISSHIKVENWVITMRGNIYIEDSGWLEVKNSSIYMDVPSDGYFEVYVKEGGKLTMDNSNLLTPYKKYGEDLYYRYHYFTFKVDGQAYINDSTVRNTYLDKANGIDGITVGISGLLSVVRSNLIWGLGDGISRYAIMPITDQPAITIEQSVISMNQNGAIFTNNAYNLTVKDTLIKNMPGGINVINSGNVAISGNVIKRIQGTGIEIKDSIATVDNNTIDSTYIGIRADTDNSTITYNSVEGAGNGSIGFDIYRGASLYDCQAMHSGIGLYAHTSMNVYDCIFTLNTHNYIVSGTVHVWYSVMFKVRYMNSPVNDGYVLVKNDDTVIANRTVKNGATAWAYYEMERIGSTSQIWFNLTAEAHYKDMVMQSTIAHSPHQIITINFAPIQEHGAIGATEQSINWWQYAIAMILFIAITVVAWFKKILRTSVKGLTAILLGGSILISNLMGVIGEYVSYALLVVVAGTFLALYLKGKARGIVIIGTLGILGYIAYTAGWFNLSLNLWDNVKATVSMLFVAGILAVLYIKQGIGRGKEYLYFPTSGLLLAATYGVITGNYLFLYIGIVLSIMAVVVWYVLASGANISFGAAALVLALVVIVAIAIAYMLGMWWPGMYIEQVTTELVKQANPLNNNPLNKLFGW